ncbi:Ig-like domain-containing protein [Mycobacterium sp. PSTR-4-N]|uniref:Ig-like domain-containing protein n=1 Tax=Mycobacterium sp. PSTR-4-N TaxID=2917745 RepID=UPI001F14AA5A|nr:Ig-like domain-containing protein [Mycobacterium sp. PSTR-4-N]
MATRSEQFAVRRWLTLGAASAGMGAALWGLSLTGPQVGVASADTETSVSAPAGESAGPSKPAHLTRAERVEKAEARRQRVTEKRRAAHADDTDEPTVTPRERRQQRAAEAINQMTAAALERIDDRPISDARKERLEKSLATTRRAFFNQAPTVNPVQVTGVMDGPISGTVGAEDPDGDRLRYRLVTGPSTGSVTINKDGSYTYTPGEGFTGVDTFVVAARDLGLHVNLLNWFRPAATRAESVINHRAITYDFTWIGDEWTPDRKAAFQRAADYIAGFFVVRTPVVLKYELTAINDPDYLVNADTLAAFTEPPGFLQTSIQHEILTGVDVENGAVQAFMNWNFAWEWATGDVIADDEYDFQNTARHELLHSYGIYDLAGSDLGFWSVYDRFLTTADGTSLFGPDGKLRPDAKDYLNGLNGGVYFGGPHAIAAYGKPIPLSKQGSPSHLDRFVFSGDDFKLMNDKSPGPGWHNVRFISPIEYAMLQDIGFTLRPQPLS